MISSYRHAVLGLATAHAGLKPCSIWARYEVRGRLLGTPGFTEPKALGARQDSVTAAITLMQLAGAGDIIGAQPSPLGACSVQAAGVCIPSSSRHGEDPAAGRKAVLLTVLSDVAAVSSQNDARKDAHTKNEVTLARAAIDDAKTYIYTMAASRAYFAAARRAWSDLPDEVCPECTSNSVP